MSAPHILIVDDDLALLQGLPEALELRIHGITVDTADSAQAALKCLEGTDYDALVCDIKMPGMDGLALLAKIRELRPDLPTLLITGHGEHELAVQALRGGAYDFIQKPIDRDYFVASLNRAIQMRQLSRQVQAQRLALERHTDELEQLVQERTRALLEANRDKDELLALLDTLLASAPVGLAFLDRDLRYVRINDAWAAMRGAQPEHILGRTIREVLPALASTLEPLCHRVLDTGEAILNVEVSGTTPAAPEQSQHRLVSYYPVRLQNEQPLGVGVVVTDITERKRMEEELKASLQQKEMLLREIHHRVKNNLQIISSLLGLQSDYISDPQVLALFRDSQDRIRSMALIHEKLYRSGNLARIDFTSYIGDLAAELLRSYGVDANRVSLQIVGEKVWLNVDTAVPCGLILQELVSNCLKHAFPEGRSGEITITLRDETEGKYALTVRDTGIGFPEGLDFCHTESLGLQLVIILTEQLSGTIVRQPGEGTCFTLMFTEVGSRESH
jgi:PAS domain S-box-containing protein